MANSVALTHAYMEEAIMNMTASSVTVEAW